MRSAGKFYLMVNQILINAEDKIGLIQQNMEKQCPSKKQLFFHLHSTCEADIWWRAFTNPKKKNCLVGNHPYIDVFGKISRSKVKGMKINEQFFNFLRRKLRHIHVQKASESSKNPFKYRNFKSKSFVTNLLLVLWPFNWHKKLIQKYFKIHDISWFFK